MRTVSQNFPLVNSVPGGVWAFNKLYDVNTLSWVSATSATSPLTGAEVYVTNWPASLAVTGPLTNTQLRASPVDVNAIQSGTWTVTTALAPVTASAQSSVASSASSVTLIAANASRKSASIYNDSTQILYVHYGATASSTSYKVKMFPEDYFELPQPIYPGIVSGIWASANGSARITEET